MVSGFHQVGVRVLNQVDDPTSPMGFSRRPQRYGRQAEGRGDYAEFVALSLREMR